MSIRRGATPRRAIIQFEPPSYRAKVIAGVVTAGLWAVFLLWVATLG